ncbi:MAG: hypothetical protein LBJ92_02585 [Holosporales bacterium]|jgi:hypothetical protein|nr:hypothetical protein [Holosporales bacterium]
MKTQLIFKDTGKTFKTSEIYAINILEAEGEVPRCIVDVPKALHDKIRKFDTCDVVHNKKLMFMGRIASLLIDGMNLKIELRALIPDSPIPEPPDPEDSPHEILEKFRLENPDISIPIIRDQLLRVGERMRISLIIPDTEPIDIQNSILFDSLKIKHNKQAAISEISAEITASWIAHFEGDIDLAARIANRFKAGRINTLTPKKLMHSWPGFGARISHHQNAKATKYYVSHSRLEEDPSIGATTPIIQIADDIPGIKLRRGFFDGKLTISWGFDQFMTETLSTRIKVGENTDRKVEKLKINLHNVQEFVEDSRHLSKPTESDLTATYLRACEDLSTGSTQRKTDYGELGEKSTEMRSFFTSTSGQLILENIFEGIGNYIALSMRNIEISFTIPFTDETLNLGCDTWIKIDDYVAKITNIEFEINTQKRIVKITAMAFEGHPSIIAKLQASSPSLKPPAIPPKEDAEFCASDILHDIVVQNEAESQFTKLKGYIDDLKRTNKINKDNYKKLILNFLSENQTKIMIIVKPLKTKHCEKRLIEIQEPLQFF